MDARFLTPEHRQRLKTKLVELRTEIEDLTKWQRKHQWYTDDPMLNVLDSVQKSLHAAVNLVPRDDVPVKKREPRPQPTHASPPVTYDQTPWAAGR